MNTSPRIYPFSRNSNDSAGFKTLRSALLPLAAAVALAAGPAQAANLLVNPSFELNSGRVVPTGWTRFAPPTAHVPPNLWIEGNVTNQSGSQHFKEWGAC